MPAGMLVWDASGNLVVDTTTFLGRYLGQASIGSGTGTIVNDQFTTGVPWCIPVLENASSINVSNTFGFADSNLWLSAPTFSFSGNTLTWTRVSLSLGNNSYPSCTLIYGVR
jgi:hypothetical protein